MKLSSAIAVILISAYADSSWASEENCIAGGFHLPDIAGPCNYDTVIAAFAEVFENTLIKKSGCNNTAEEELHYLLKSSSPDDLKASIDETCHGAMDDAKKIPFSDISQEGDQFEEVFFNGGTYWNEETETNLETNDGSAANVLRNDAKNVKYFYNFLAQTTHVEWPGQLTNFDLDTCKINAAYCCWPRDRQARDGNGNCDTPYDTNCVDKDPADNTDLCYLDNERGKRSTGVENGFSVYKEDNNDGEGPVHCHGFAWSNDKYDFTSRYKANNLFFVSMYDHMHQRGYVQNIPGAPMCACAEQMPTVTRSDCTQIDVDETYKLEYHPDVFSFTAKLTEIEIDFNSCRGLNNRNNDLSAYMGRLQKEGKVTTTQRGKLAKYLVENGNCPYAIDAFLNEKGYVRGYKHDESLWTKVAGRDSLAAPSLGREGFRKLFEHSPNQIIQRVCITCAPSHQLIYYKRVTKVPEDMDLLNYLKNHWQSKNNTLNTDFKLFSSYQDALNDANPWLFCNYDHSHTGFPRDCGPTKSARNQWNKFEWRSGREDVAFYVEKGDLEFNDVNGDDIGNVAYPGLSLENNGLYYVTATGEQIWGTQDEFHFISEEANGDLNLVVKVSSIADIDRWSNAGLMIRDSLDPDSKFVMVTFSRTYGVSTWYRTETSENAGWSHSGLSPTEESWLKLTRRGNIYQGYRSTNGLDWISVGNPVTAYFDNGENDHVGMTLASYRDGYYAEAVFEDYHFENFFYPSAAPSLSLAPSAFIFSRDIGDVYVPGTASQAGDSYIVKGSGYDIWGSSDRFHYVSTEASNNDGGITLTVKLSSLVNSYRWSKAGLMIRETFEPNSKFVMVVLTGDYGASLMWRSTTGGYCSHQTSWKHRNSVWLKLKKLDEMFSGYWSDDGTSWNKLRDINVNMEETFNTGLAVTSSSRESTLVTAHFHHYSQSSFTMSPTVSLVPTATPLFSFGAMQKGSCVKANGEDQKKGVRKLSDLNQDDRLEDCRKKCLQSGQAIITGCEAIWHQHHRGCYVHTQSVDRGDGVDKRMCWIATSL